MLKKNIFCIELCGFSACVTSIWLVYGSMVYSKIIIGILYLSIIKPFIHTCLSDVNKLDICITYMIMFQILLKCYSAPNFL